MDLRRILLVVVLLAGACGLFAGDIANFINLGFSDDDRYFMFGEFGVNEETSFPFADLFVVNVSNNQFVDQGAQNGVYSVSAEPGSEGQGAILTLLEQNNSLRKRYAINHLKTGRMLYLRVDGERPKADLDFRDFVTGTRYLVHLTQEAFGSGKSVSSSFHIDLTVISSNGNAKEFAVGLPDYKRKGVKEYAIRQVLLSPAGKAIIFLMEKNEVNETGSNIRYMVETVSIR